MSQVGLHSQILRTKFSMRLVSFWVWARLYGIQFHPEVVHTQKGTKLIENFVRKICECKPAWDMLNYEKTAIREIREKVGKGRVLCGVSGGVDSTVAAALIHRAVGNQLSCVFVNNGVLRQNEAEQVK